MLECAYDGHKCLNQKFKYVYDDRNDCVEGLNVPTMTKKFSMHLQWQTIHAHLLKLMGQIFLHAYTVGGKWWKMFKSDVQMYIWWPEIIELNIWMCLQKKTKKKDFMHSFCQSWSIQILHMCLKWAKMPELNVRMYLRWPEMFKSSIQICLQRSKTVS